MFIKEAYERRIKQQLQSHSPTYLKIKQKSPAIGSKNTGKINFSNSQTFFNENDIPQKSKTLKAETKQFKDADILQLKKKKWNISVSSPRNFDKFEDSHQDVLYKIKHGFLDYQHGVKEKQYKQYPGVDTRNSYKNWNVSTELGRNQKSQNYHHLLINSLQNTLSYNQNKLKKYIKPTERYQRQRSFEKQRSLNESQLINTFQQQYKTFNPNASPQKTNATVFKLLEDTRRQRLKQSMFISRDQMQLSRKFKANLSDSQKVNISYKYTHNGSWSQVPWAEEGYAWSCCMNQDKNGKGCIKNIIDANKPNFSSFNNA